MISPERFNATLCFALQAHGSQVDKNGTPYILHPMRVAEAAVIRQEDEFVVQAALLHDVVEDTSVSLSDIDGVFGRRVCHLVDLLTRQLGQTYSDFIERLVLSGDRDAMRLKFYDICDNMRDDRRVVGESFESRRNRWIRYDKAQDQLIQAGAFG